MNEKQRQAILLLASGKTGVKVAESLQVTPKTVSTWRSQPEFKAELNKHLLDIQSAHSERLRSLCTTALQTIENCLNDESISAKDKLRASFKVLHLAKVQPLEIGSIDAVELEFDEKLRL
ncbi:helix-turn-helix domain-containing protein [Nitrosomonas marina]|uniref:Homeodomain-like domain-containing protein n=1 Tax=Nitrosomonas marina TaxID=917 RepID=A0A1H8GFQ4_9PROT|nr:helix-turn-helix domain-containing protein [Nitrosomonas marina]SEN42866.1 hypothetical protein SAMN05216325_1183 [Nitrosomonas marina]